MEADKPKSARRKKKAVAKKTAMKKGKSKSSNDLVTKTQPIVSRYLDDGNIQSVIGVDENGTCMGFPSAEITNTLNLIARICKAREGSIGKEELMGKLNSAISVFTEMKPKDSVEAMIVTQMISVHEMALRSAERALLTDQPDEFVGKNINRATKLMRTYTALVEALSKYRNKGKQQITVQHVNVNDGGQAIVGDVTQGGGIE